MRSFLGQTLREGSQEVVLPGGRRLSLGDGSAPAWRRRFMAQRVEIAGIRGERFCRMWEFYLAASEIGFRYAGHMVFQRQLAKKIDVVPLTRNYIDVVPLTRNYIDKLERDIAEDRYLAA